MSPEACSPLAKVPKGAQVPGAPPVAFFPEGGQVASFRWLDKNDASAASTGLEGDRVSAVTSISWNHPQAPGHPTSHVPRLLKGILPLKCSSAEPAAAGGSTFARIFACRRDVAAGSPPRTPRPGARGVARLRRHRLSGWRQGDRSARAAPTGLRDRAQGGPVLRATRRWDPRALAAASAPRPSELRARDPAPCSAQPLGGRWPRG